MTETVILTAPAAMLASLARQLARPPMIGTAW